jgi:hypothetical protein
MKVVFTHPLLDNREFSQKSAEKLENMPNNGGWKRLENKTNAATSNSDGNTVDSKRRIAGRKKRKVSSDTTRTTD